MADAKTTNAKTKEVVSPIGRVSFPDLFVPRAAEEGKEPRYGVTLLFAEGTDLSVLKAEAARAAKEKFGDKIPAGFRSPFRDGNEKADKYDGYAGTTFVKFTTKYRPAVVDGDVRPIAADSDRMYAGCYARVACSAYAYNKAGNAGVSFNLVFLQKTGDGEPFGSAANPEDVFSVIGSPDDLPEGAANLDDLPF